MNKKKIKKLVDDLDIILSGVNRDNTIEASIYGQEKVNELRKELELGAFEESRERRISKLKTNPNFVGESEEASFAEDDLPFVSQWVFWVLIVFLALSIIVFIGVNIIE